MAIPNFNTFARGRKLNESETIPQQSETLTNEPHADNTPESLYQQQREKESMVTQNLYNIIKKAKYVYKQIKKTENEDIPEWIQEMLASVNDRMNTIHDQMSYETETHDSETLGTNTDAVDLDVEFEDDSEFEESFSEEEIEKSDFELDSDYQEDMELDESRKFRR